MTLTCPHCQENLDFTGSRPKFCSNCGHLLGDGRPTATVPEAEAPTRPPQPAGEAETQPPGAPGAGGAAPAVVGPYRLVRRLGGGGMGSVYEAEDTSTGRHVALKLIEPEYAASPDAIDRFRREGELASRLAHPRCVFVLAADEDKGRPYIVMELMTGSTLDDLVREKGPLPPEDALRKILDVIEGLHEAHQLGLVHRDVKPSNCFIEENGRVKVGDFGLAKSLVAETHLTRTGTFLGTPLYAAPEQIKKEAVDAQSDIYSVAATLYFLLTGRAPFQSGDPMATMARIVADDPPPMRTLRPELPKALDRAVLRGLERDRKRRWRSLDEFRRALLPFLPAEPSVGGLGLRLPAFLMDAMLFMTLLAGTLFLVDRNLVTNKLSQPSARVLGEQLTRTAVGAVLFLAYFGVLEGRWGCSLGKRVLRLRVGTAAANQAPGLGPAVLRAAIFFGLVNGGVIVLTVTAAVAPQIPWRGPVVPLLERFWVFGALGLLFGTVRKRNGYRGLHEFLSGTRTYQLRWPKDRKRAGVKIPAFDAPLHHPKGLPEHLGPYRIHGVLHESPRDQTLLAEDTQLGRGVWLWLRPEGEPPVSEARRAAGRTTRLRWLSCGTWAGRQWDAFLASSGCPLPTALADRRRLSWAEFRGILHDLSEELQVSCAEATLPPSLGVSQVWVQPGGRVQLVETPVGNDAPLTPAELCVAAGDHARALALLRDVAVLALEGKPRAGPADPSHVNAPLPLHAAGVMNRLLAGAAAPPTPAGHPRPAGAERPYGRVDELRADLLATQDEPAEITRATRAKHLVWLGVFAVAGLLFSFAVFALVMGLVMTFVSPQDLERLHQAGSSKSPSPPRPPAAAEGQGPAVAATPEQGHANKDLEDFGDRLEKIFLICLPAYLLLLLFLPPLLLRGGWRFAWMGTAVVRGDGRPASRLRCLWRAVCAWGFIGILAGVGTVGVVTDLVSTGVGLGMDAAAALLLVGYVALILRNPARAPHDYLAGTYLVPK